MTAAARPAAGWARRWLCLPALFTALALVMVRPTRPDRLPENLGDPALIIWIMSWGAHGLVTRPAHLFDAPMFWPNGSTYAYADALLTPMVPYSLVHALTRSWTASLIVVSLLFSVLAEAGAYLSALRVTGRRDAALLAAIAFAFGGYGLGHWPSLQVASIGILALALVAFLHLLDQPSVGRGALLGLATIATFYAGAYYGALLLLLLGLLAPLVLLGRALRRSPSTARLLAGLAVAGALAGLAILPNAVVSFRLQHDLHLTRPLAPEFDLRPHDLLRPTAHSYLWRGIDVPAPRASAEHRFFPGAIAALLGTVGLVVVAVRLARRRPLGPPDRPRAAVDLLLLTTSAVVSLLLAVGSTGIGPLAPWTLVHAHVPGFSAIRATSRLAVPALLAGAVLVAVGYAALTQRLPARRGLRTALVAACAALMLVDLSAARDWARLDTSSHQLAVYRSLAPRPAGAVLELPIADPSVEALRWAYEEAPRLVYATIDWHPRVNGYSGYFPPGYVDDVRAYQRFPDVVAVDRLRARQVRYVILHIGEESGFTDLSEVDVADRLTRLPPGATSTRRGCCVLVDLGPPGPAP